MKINLARGLEEVVPRPPRDEELFIAMGGPSLRETAHELKGKRIVWALNGAHDWLIDHGITPTHGICQAPEDQILGCFERAQAGVVYAFASCTHPQLVDKVLAKGGRVVFWHCKCPEGWGVEYGDRPQVCGGGTIGLRALDLAWLVGFREVHVLGFDACMSSDGRIGPDTPMYEDRLKDVRSFWIHGREFKALPSHARQVEDLAATIRPLTGLNITFYGDGLMQWAMKGNQ